MWTFELIDLAGNRLLPLTKARERKLTRGLSRVATASCLIDLSDPALEYLATQDCGIQVWQDKTCRFRGPVTLDESVGDNAIPGVRVTAASPYWRLTKRLSGRSATGTNYGVFGAVDRAVIAGLIISQCNVDGETGIQVGTTSSGSTVSYIAGPYKPTADCIKELSDAIDGFEWIEEPLFGVAGKLVEWNAGAVIGGIQVDSVFEYGRETGRHNLAKYTISRDRSTLANSVWHISDDGAASTVYPPVNDYDATSILARGLYEDIADGADLTDPTIRHALTQEHVRVRKDPRIILTVTPAVRHTGEDRVPLYGTDYGEGDWVPVRIVENGFTQFNGYARIYAVTVTLDNNGKESIELTLIDEDTP